MFLHNYRLHFICLDCRRSIKRAANVRSASQMRGEKWDTPAIRCAICRGELMCVGRKFAAPKRNDEASWKKLEWMIEQGWRGGAWPTSPAMNLNQVREALLAQREARVSEMKRVQQAVSFDEIKQRARHKARGRRKALARKRERDELEAQRNYQDAVLARVNRES